MTSLLKPLIASGLALALLTGCDPSGFTGEIGAGDGAQSFGDATTINTLAMMGEGQATQVLGQRFASEVANTVTFAFNSDVLTPEARATLARQAAWIRRFPEVRFSVYGHTDRVGTEAYNKGLGLRRARAAVAFLEAQGISGTRLQALVSYGETRPVINTQAPEERNRRAVTTVSGFAKGYSGLMNGKYAAIVMRDYIKSAAQPLTPVSKSGSTLAVAE